MKIHNKSAYTPNLVVEAVLSAFRWFLIFVAINNAVWAGFYFSSGKTNIKMIQDGTGNTNYTQTISTPDQNN